MRKLFWAANLILWCILSAARADAVVVVVTGENSGPPVSSDIVIDASSGLLWDAPPVTTTALLAPEYPTWLMLLASLSALGLMTFRPRAHKGAISAID